MSATRKYVTTLFARASKQGRVKRRLAVDVGDYLALETHRFLVSKTLGSLEGIHHDELQLWVDDISELYENDPLYPMRSRLFAQKGDSLGQRMANAIKCNVNEGRVPIVIGSDCPLMDISYLDKAQSVLESDFDLVIGPADDGGYVLIGMTRFHKALFEDIDWGTERVMEQTLAAALKLGLSVKLLDVLWDVDRVEDLEQLTSLCLPGYPVELKEIGLVKTWAIS